MGIFKNMSKFVRQVKLAQIKAQQAQKQSINFDNKILALERVKNELVQDVASLKNSNKELLKQVSSLEDTKNSLVQTVNDLQDRIRALESKY